MCNFQFLRTYSASLLSSLVDEIIKHQETFTHVPLKSQTEEASHPFGRTITTHAKKLRQQGNKKKKNQFDVFFIGPFSVCYNCPPKPENQTDKESSPRQTELEPLLNVAHRLWQWEDDAPSFSLGISFPVSQPTPMASQSTVTQLEMLADVVMDARVTAALKFVAKTSTEPSFTTAAGYKTPEKEKEITEELKEQCYHWMTQLKETKDTTNEYDTIFMLNHEAHLEGLRHHFLSLMPRQDVENTVVNAVCMILNDRKCRWFEEEIYFYLSSSACKNELKYASLNFMLENYGVNYIDPNTNKAYRIIFLTRKLASHPFLFAPVCNGGRWWLWIADVKKKAFYVLDPVNKKKDEIPETIIKLKKFVVRLIVSQMRVYSGAKPLINDGEGVEAEYIKLSD
ncbi:hypothetical protein Ahy_A04g020522 [Arachis hypogaea]|uniref:Ubiquitin-like protease family profile domain-containing protein n=1 Tax=Arachis hypogaea TaxID=3818 RepID=A0A445DHW9_ARAHY|nr:hypothetical protein Ahy_A04g020522 [Arachis hypogaea]